MAENPGKMETARRAVAAPEGDRAALLGTVLALEMQARQQASAEALRFFAVNETRKACPYRQAFLIEDTGGRPRVAAMSSLSSVDRDVPLVRSFERLAARVQEKREGDPRKAQHFLIDAFGEDDEATRDYPFKHLCWLPLPRRSAPSGDALLLARDAPWRQHELAVLEALGDAYGHAFDALLSRPRVWSVTRKRRSMIWLAVAAMVVLVSVIPVRLTALAPAEIVAAQPVVVSAPLDGVIAELPVEPNTPVADGDVVLALVDTKFRNDAEVTARNVVVAEAKLRRAVQGAFGSARDNREVAIAQAELDVRKAEAAYAQELLERTRVRAGAAGLLLYSSKSDWIGRPVTTGERIMEVADPRKLEVRIDLPVSDVITAKDGARVVVYLDSNPLAPIEAVLARASYQASVTGEGQYAFRLFARLSVEGEQLPRIGTRGTAQVYGERVSLFFYLFRRPITAIRQRLGV